MVYIKEYYEIVDEARLLSGCFPTHADFFLRKCISNHETQFQSDPSSNCFTIDRRLVYFILSYCFFFCISFFTNSVVFDM